MFLCYLEMPALFYLFLEISLKKPLIPDPFWLWVVTSEPCYGFWNLSVSSCSLRQRTRVGEWHCPTGVGVGTKPEMMKTLQRLSAPHFCDS